MWRGAEGRLELRRGVRTPDRSRVGQGGDRGLSRRRGRAAPRPRAAAGPAHLRARRHDEPPADLGPRLRAAGGDVRRGRPRSAASPCSSSISAASARPRLAWVADARALGRLMVKIACHGGQTQIGRVLTMPPARPRGSRSRRSPMSATRWRRTSTRSAARPARSRCATSAPSCSTRGGTRRRAHLPRDRPADRRSLCCPSTGAARRSCARCWGGRHLCRGRAAGARGGGRRGAARRLLADLRP